MVKAAGTGGSLDGEGGPLDDSDDGSRRGSESTACSPSPDRGVRGHSRSSSSSRRSCSGRIRTAAACPSTRRMWSRPRRSPWSRATPPCQRCWALSRLMLMLALAALGPGRCRSRSRSRSTASTTVARREAPAPERPCTPAPAPARGSRRRPRTACQCMPFKAS